MKHYLKDITISGMLILQVTGCGGPSKEDSKKDTPPAVNSNPNNPYPAGSDAAACGEQDLMYDWLKGECMADVKLVTWTCDDTNIREHADLEFSSGDVESYDNKLSSDFKPVYCGESETTITVALSKPGEKYETLTGATLPKKIDRTERVKALGYGGTWSASICNETIARDFVSTISGLAITETLDYYDWPECKTPVLTIKREGAFNFVSYREGDTVIALTWNSYKIQKLSDKADFVWQSRCDKITYTTDETDYVDTSDCFKEKPGTRIRDVTEKRRLFLKDGKFYTSFPESLVEGTKFGQIDFADWTKSPEYAAEPDTSYIEFGRVD